MLRNPSHKFSVPNAVVEYRSRICALAAEAVVGSASTGGLNEPDHGEYSITQPAGGVNRERVIEIGGAARNSLIYVHPDAGADFSAPSHSAILIALGVGEG